MRREYSKYSSLELRELFLACDQEYDTLMQIINELRYRSPQQGAYVLKGILEDEKGPINKSVEEIAQEKHLKDPPMVEPKFEIAKEEGNTPLGIGQEVDDMIIIDIDIKKGIFFGKAPDGIIYECDIEPCILPKTKPMIEERIENSVTNTISIDGNKLENELILNKKNVINIDLFPDISEENNIGGTIRPTGNISGLPTKREFPLKTEIQINLPKNTSLIVKYEAAITALIKELKGKGSSSQHFVLEDGKQGKVDGNGIGYQFSWDGEVALFEGAHVFVSVGNEYADGRIVAVMECYIVINLSQDMGPHIASCTVRVDNTAMLEVLRTRFESIIKGEDTGFNVTLAEAVVFNRGDEIAVCNENPINMDGLNAQQVEAVEKMLANEVFYLWGPPGTGKTMSLSALSISLLEGGKRVLVCSNTNQAVDQVLLKLCDKLKMKEESSLEDGLIVRVGQISHPELKKQWGKYVIVDEIVARKSLDLQKQKVNSEEQIDAFSESINNNQKIIDKFKKIDVLCKEEIKIRNSQMKLGKKYEALLSRKIELEQVLRKLKDEKMSHSSANQLRRFFLRSEEDIVKELQKVSTSYEKEMAELNGFEIAATAEKEIYADMQKQIARIEIEVKIFNRKLIETKICEDNGKKQTLIDEVTKINKKLDEITKTVLDSAKIVGATVAKVFLSKQMFKEFDVVIIDEASMIMLPSVFYVSGLAKEKVIISGDPRQLSAIIQTEQKAIFDILGKNIFDECGITTIRNKTKAKRFIMLEEQYRMHDKICKLLSLTMYKNKLRTSKDRKNDDKMPPEPFNNRLVIIDTSSIGAFDNRDQFKSRYNLMHALAIRNLCLSLKHKGYMENDNPANMVGVCTPYAAQAKVLQRMLQSAGLEEIAAGTVHRYQGDEKSMMILDITDSNTERRVSVFLEANNIDDNGSKLFNVAISRAKSNLIVVANLIYLDKKLPQYAFLRGIISEMTKKGKVIDVRKVLSLYPILEDLKKYGQQFDLSPQSLATGLFNEKDFHMVCLADIENSRKGVAIYSAFITPQRVATYETIFRRKIQNGVVIRCVTRPPNKNGSMSKEDSVAALNSLEKIGCIVDTRNVIHEKAVIIDDKVVWFGSLNPLSHTEKTNEMMARIEGDTVALQIAAFLSLDKGANPDTARGISVQRENPRCPDCGARTSYNIGKFGPYWCCEDCDWKNNVGRSIKTKQALILTGENAPLCPLCGDKTLPKTGRYGEFYGCCNFPKCNGIAKNKLVKT